VFFLQIIMLILFVSYTIFTLYLLKKTCVNFIGQNPIKYMKKLSCLGRLGFMFQTLVHYFGYGWNICDFGILVLFFAINEIRPHYPVFDVVLMSYQDLGIITLYYFDWNRNLAQLFFIFRVALFDVDVVEPTCAFEWGFNEAYRMMLSLPFAFAVVQAAAYALGFKSGDEAYAGTLSFFVEAQASLLYYCISTFICRKIRPGNRSVYVEDPDTSCETASTTTMQIIAVFYLLLILVVTLMLFQRLWTAASADELRSPHILARYGFLYRRLRMGAGFWWAVRMTKQAALVAILAWWSDPEDQAIFALLVLTTFAVFHALVRPETLRPMRAFAREPAEAANFARFLTAHDRLQARGVEPQFLDIQYRMHPALSAFPSLATYGGRITSGGFKESRPCTGTC